MLDIHLSVGQGLLIETPSGDVELYPDDIRPQASEVDLEVSTPEEWEAPSYSTTYAHQQEFTIPTPDGQIRIKVLRFRPRPDGTGGAVSLGIDAPRAWPISR